MGFVFSVLSLGKAYLSKCLTRFIVFLYEGVGKSVVGNIYTNTGRNLPTECAMKLGHRWDCKANK